MTPNVAQDGLVGKICLFRLEHLARKNNDTTRFGDWLSRAICASVRGSCRRHCDGISWCSVLCRILCFAQLLATHVTDHVSVRLTDVEKARENANDTDHLVLCLEKRRVDNDAEREE